MSDQFGGLPPAPPAPQGYGYVEERGPRPNSVRNAVNLMFVQAGLSVVSLIVLFATESDFKNRLRAATPAATDATINAAVTIALITSLVFVVLYALLAWQVGRGKNWARIVTWVFGGLGIISGLVNLGQSAPPLSKIIGILSLLIAISIVVLLALKQSHPYFRRQTY